MCLFIIMSKTKKILICTGIYPPDIGGPATYVKTLENELPKHGFEVRIITYADESSNDNNIIKINRNEAIIIKYLKYFTAVLNNISWADSVYAQGPFSSGLPVWLASKIKKKKYYLKVVGDYAWERGQQKAGIIDSVDDFQDKKYDFLTELVRMIEQMVARNAEKVIVPSRYLKSIVEKWGLVDSRIKVIYNAVKDASLAINKTEARKKLGLEGFAMITGGRLTPWKGLMLLVDLLPELLKVKKDIKLVIAGTGTEEQALRRRVDELKLNKSVFFTGKLPQMELWEYMRASDLFVLNTAYEGLPHIIIEAMKLGCPVAISNVCGNPEVVTDGSNGALFEYNNKEDIKKAIKKYFDQDFYHRMQGNLEEGMERFKKEKMIGELLTDLH